MDPNTRALLMGAAGAGGAEKLYVEDVFSTWLYTGNGSTQTITNGIDLAGEGGLVWLKGRSVAYPHCLYDTARGTTNVLKTNSASAAASAPAGLTNFNSNGFTLGSESDSNVINQTFASWTFRKAEKYFDVVTWTGNGSNRTIAHNLGSVPGCIIVKRTDTSGDWQVYHRSLANTEYMVLNDTAAKATGATRWNSTTPTSTVFSLGTDATVNANTGTYVAYLFAHDAGGFGDSGNESVVKCGSFTTDGSGNATVDLGWEPQWLLAKRNEAGEPWVIADNMRGWTAGSSGSFPRLEPNTSSSEANTSSWFGPTSTGFVTGGNAGANKTYIYIAIRRGPMKTPTDATKVFNAAAQNGAGTVTTGFPVDLSISRWRVSPAEPYWRARMTGLGYLLSSSTQEEFNDSATSAIEFTSNTSIKDTVNSSAVSISYHSFRRAPGFFDVSCYTGTGSATTISHSLGVAPELMIVKKRSGADEWVVYHADRGATKYFWLQATNAEQTGTNRWNDTAPTSSVFSVGSSSSTNGNGATFIAYLFASVAGVSKVGSYTGTGTTLSIDCGFTAGARFVLIKRTDSTGDWYVWDTARGIVSGNDPYLLLNSTAAEVTSTDYIDPLNSGFQISSTAPAAINANGGTFIYLAIA